MNTRTPWIATAALLATLLTAGCESSQPGDRTARGGEQFSPAWNQLQSGMQHTEVYNLLGAPIDVRVSAVQTTWFYSDRGTDGPRVIFDTPGMKIERWISPSRER